jgi:hypothetical protein
MTAGEEDMQLLRKTLDEELSEYERDAFADMLSMLHHGRRLELSPKQREWLKQVAERVGAQFDYQNLVSEGKAPRGREVASMVTDHPLKPPKRASSS